MSDVVTAESAVAASPCRFTKNVGKNLMYGSNLGKVRIGRKAVCFELIELFGGNLMIEIFCNKVRIEFFPVIDDSWNAEFRITDNASESSKRFDGIVVVGNHSLQLETMLRVENIVLEGEEGAQRKSHVLIPQVITQNSRRREKQRP